MQERYGNKRHHKLLILPTIGTQRNASERLVNRFVSGRPLVRIRLGALAKSKG
jgi:hypothetical protein